VPVVLKATGAREGLEREEEEDYDEESAFQPLADCMSEIVADSQRKSKMRAPGKPASMLESNCDLQPYVVPGFGKSVRARCMRMVVYRTKSVADRLASCRCS
jgi:hypothetical protein